MTVLGVAGSCNAVATLVLPFSRLGFPQLPGLVFFACRILGIVDDVFGSGFLEDLEDF